MRRMNKTLFSALLGRTLSEWLKFMRQVPHPLNPGYVS